jgi:hypothetical protein
MHFVNLAMLNLAMLNLATLIQEPLSQIMSYALFAAALYALIARAPWAHMSILLAIRAVLAWGSTLSDYDS